jgi:hypothetical protein
MMFHTAGLMLKKKLGLDSLPFVYITRVLNAGSYRLYFIIYDTNQTTLRIPQSYADMEVFPYFISMVNASIKSKFSLLIRLEKFEASLKGAFFIAVDLAGRYRHPERLSFVYEQKNEIGYTKTNLEEITLSALKNPASTSALTKGKELDRRRIMRGGENIIAKLLDVEVNRSEDWVTFKFLTEATKPDPATLRPGVPPPGKGEVDPSSGMAIKPNPSKLYEIDIRILKFFSWVGTKPEGEPIRSADIKEVLRIADVQLWSNSPSFWWQGMAYMLTQVDASIHPCNIAPQTWNAAHLHGDTYFLDKHTDGLLKQINFFIPQMASMLAKRLGGSR